MLDQESWTVGWKNATAHTSPLYSLAHIEHGCLSGDEDGTVRLWDFRTDKCAMESKRFDEFVSGFYIPEGGHTAIAASGEGTIQVRINKHFLIMLKLVMTQKSGHSNFGSG